MSFLSQPPTLLAAALPIGPNLFMAAIVLSACTYGALVVFNYLSLKYKSTNRYCVASVMLLVAGLLVGEASIALTFDDDAPPLLQTNAGRLAVALLVIAAGVAVFGFIHCYLHRRHYRRGRKRALGAFVFSLVAIGALFNLSSTSKSPHTRAAPKTKVELIRETDAYGRPLATPEPATPAPEPVPAPPPRVAPLPVPQVPLGTPARIATPTPARLLPSVISPN
ncbi:MAG TPA: hypothetical protein VGO11_11810 [Chthoniobacteraceae bacterium]|jgi:hypothetical protein|nr:hypothetical protein [Chthoniobacteraceae bacterium]